MTSQEFNPNGKEKKPRIRRSNAVVAAEKAEIAARKAAEELKTKENVEQNEKDDNMTQVSNPNEGEPREATKEEISALREKRRAERKKTPGALNGQRLYATPRKGYRRRFVNDTPGRVQSLEANGWQMVKHENSGAFSTDDGVNTSQVVGSSKEGGALRTFLMEIPEEFYQEDQAEKENRNKQKEESLKTASLGGGSLNSGGNSTAYAPGNSHFKPNS